MSINKERIRAKLAALQGGNNSYWSPPKSGQATIRAFAIPDHTDPFLDLFYHYGVGKNSIYCLRKNRDENGREGKCPICEQADEWFRGDEDEKEMSKKIYSKPRIYAAVIDRADKEPQAKYWGFGKQIGGKLMTWLAEEDGDREDFLDLDNGLDLVVTATQSGKTMNGKPIADIDVNTRLKASPICAKKDQEALLKTLKPHAQLFPRPTLQEVQEKLKSWLDDLGAPDDEAPVPESEGVSKPAPENRRASKEDIDSLFDNIDNMSA